MPFIIPTFTAHLSSCRQLNRAEFDGVDDETRVQYEGFRPGMYVRLEIPSLPCEFVTNFDPHYPIILGGLSSAEGNVGYLQVRLVKTRYTIWCCHSKDHWFRREELDL